MIYDQNDATNHVARSCSANDYFCTVLQKIPTVRTCLNCNSGGTAIKLDAKEWLHKCIIGQMHQNTREDANCERMQHNGDGCKL